MLLTSLTPTPVPLLLKYFVLLTQSWRKLALFIVLLLSSNQAVFAQFAQAPVEVRVPQAPQLVDGSDGLLHLAYELHITNFYQSTGTLHIQQLTIFADDLPTPTVSFSRAQVNRLLAHPTTNTDSAAVPLAAGKRLVLYLWLTIPPNSPLPHLLRHQIIFIGPNGEQQLVDGVRTPLNLTPAIVLGAPLRAGPWFVYAGPGNHLAHHWGGIVVVNGQTTIPQRYALDFYGLTPTGRALRRPVAFSQLNITTPADWVSTGAEVLAVADGIVRDARDGEANQQPMGSVIAPSNLTERTMMGNFVVLEVAPHLFIHYAHLQPGSLTKKVGERVRRGTVLGRLGQSGQAQLPHLHFQVSNAVTFEESEGQPFLFQRFSLLGSTSLGSIFDQSEPDPIKPNYSRPHHQQMPLDGNILSFE